MNVKLFTLLTLLLYLKASGAVVATFRGNEPNTFDFVGSTDKNFDMNADAIADYRFTSDGSLIAAFRSYGENRFISTLAYPPNLGGYVDPVNTGS